MLFYSNYVAPANKSDPRTVDVKHLLIILELFECDQRLQPQAKRRLEQKQNVHGAAKASGCNMSQRSVGGH